MMAATVTLRMRPRPLSGPAIRRHPFPVSSLVLSSIAHAAVVGGIVAAALLWRPEPTKTYFVNLAPSVPAQGTPAGVPTSTPSAPQPPRPQERSAPTKAAPPAVPPRETAPKATRATTPELPTREVAPRSSRPAPAAELPTRTVAKLPDMPTRDIPREAARSTAKELPSLTPSAPPRSGPAVAGPRDAAPPPPPPPLGRPTGTAQGVGAAASVEGDFPFQWYLSAIQRKVYEQWTQPFSSVQGQKAIIVFEIARNGEVTRARIEKTSGDAAYDVAALRAVTGANPLPPLPPEFKGTMIRVHFGFESTGRG